MNHKQNYMQNLTMDLQGTFQMYIIQHKLKEIYKEFLNTNNVAK